MRHTVRVAGILAALVLVAAPLYAAQIQGDYIEARSADVYTGPCYGNSEVGLTGDTATMAWRVRAGEWQGIALDGLSVVAVAKASATLGDTFSNPYPARTVLIVDARATEDQKCALIELAKSLGGRLVENVVAVESAPMTVEVGQGARHGAAVFKAGNLARIETRAIGDNDHLCGNEETYYPPLTGQLTHAMAAYTLADEFQGKGLDTQWKVFGKRSAFVGTFAR